jgi:hypothetical protein
MTHSLSVMITCKSLDSSNFIELSEGDASLKFSNSVLKNLTQINIRKPLKNIIASIISLQSHSETRMNGGELDIDYKWLSEKLEEEKKEVWKEVYRLSKENKTLRAAIWKLFDRLSIVSGAWIPAVKPKVPTEDNLYDEGYSGTLGSVVALCGRNPSLLKKFSKDIHLLFLDILLSPVHAKQTKQTSSTFFFRRDAIQTSLEIGDMNGGHFFIVQRKGHLKQRNFLSNQEQI